jgi:5'-nucleotidase
MERPLVLITNDDGIDAPGLRALAQAVGDAFDVIRVAPEREQSAVGHAVTLGRPVRVEGRGPNVWAVAGTPADCVYLGLHRLAARRPTLVISGVNHGYNLGTDVFYSGTCAGAAEAAVHGLPAIAVSVEVDPPAGAFERAAHFAATLAEWMIRTGWAVERGFVNVNVPGVASAGGPFAFVPLGRRDYDAGPEALAEVEPGHFVRRRRVAADSTLGASGPDADLVRQGVTACSVVVLDLATARLTAARRAPVRLHGYARWRPASGRTGGKGRGIRSQPD